MLPPGTRHAMSTHSELVAKGKKGATTTSPWETIGNEAKSNDANCDRQGAENQQLELGPTS